MGLETPSRQSLSSHPRVMPVIPAHRVCLREGVGQRSSLTCWCCPRWIPACAAMTGQRADWIAAFAGRTMLSQRAARAINLGGIR